MSILNPAAAEIISSGWFEWTAAGFSLAAVLLAVKPYRSNWPVAILGTFMYLLIFLEARLYSDMLLQAVFIIMQCWGWIRWRPEGGREVSGISSTGWKPWPLYVLITLLTWYFWTRGVLLYFPQAAQPWTDGLTAVLSVLAIYLQGRKKTENWLVWMLADLIYLPLYLNAGKYITAGLYAVFLLIALRGYRTWRRSE